MRSMSMVSPSQEIGDSRGRLPRSYDTTIIPPGVLNKKYPRGYMIRGNGVKRRSTHQGKCPSPPGTIDHRPSPSMRDHLRSATQAESICRGDRPPPRQYPCHWLRSPVGTLPTRPRCCTPRVGRARLPDGEADAHRQRGSTRTRAETEEGSTQVPDHTVRGPGYLYCGVLLPCEGQLDAGLVGVEHIGITLR